MGKDKKVTDVIEEVCEDMCNNYCKYPEEYLSNNKDPEEAEWKMIKEKCDNCPLRRLF